MQKQSAFMNLVGGRFVRARPRLNPRPPKSPPSPPTRGVAGRALPALSKPPPSAWPQEDCANEPSPIHCFGEQRALWAFAAKITPVLLRLIISLTAHAAGRAGGSIVCAVSNLGHSVECYTKVLR